MEAFPRGSLDHNVPFIAISGLNSDSFELHGSDEWKDQTILIENKLSNQMKEATQLLDTRSTLTVVL